jgi:CHASE2 domain-containing sensor protein
MNRTPGGPARVVNWLQRLRVLPREPRAESLDHALLVSLPWVLGISALVFGLEYFGWLTWLESSALDMALNASSRRRSEQIYIVEIMDQDYREFFGGRSPLDPDLLKDVLAKVALAKPAVIGVDLDTSAPPFRRADWPTAVWARDAEPVCAGRVDPHCTESDRFLRLPVLGGQAAEVVSTAGEIETEPKSGLILFPRDRDGVVRRYQRSFYSEMAEPASPLKGRVDSFPRAILKAYQRVHPGSVPAKAESAQTGAEHLILNFTGDRYEFPRISLGDLMKGASRPYWSEKSPLRDLIVLIGGTYRAARDDYFTPVGSRAGVEIVAQAVQSELSDGGIRPVNHLTAFAIDVGAGLLLVVLNWRIRSRFVLVIDFLFIAAVSLAGSYWAFRAFGHWFNFTAVLVSVWIHLLLEKSRHRREVQKELKETCESLLEARGALEANQQELHAARDKLVTAENELGEYRRKFGALSGPTKASL